MVITDYIELTREASFEYMKYDDDAREALTENLNFNVFIQINDDRVNAYIADDDSNTSNFEKPWAVDNINDCPEWVKFYQINF